ncbi:hypothetical protein TgHK011_001651 [Trichoderma gracile]|nr:hypothetical protein TgHK011_001651 [Trichoderma gracile]
MNDSSTSPSLYSISSTDTTMDVAGVHSSKDGPEFLLVIVRLTPVSHSQPIRFTGMPHTSPVCRGFYTHLLPFMSRPY